MLAQLNLESSASSRKATIYFSIATLLVSWLQFSSDSINLAGLKLAADKGTIVFTLQVGVACALLSFSVYNLPKLASLVIARASGRIEKITAQQKELEHKIFPHPDDQDYEPEGWEVDYHKERTTHEKWFHV